MAKLTIKTISLLVLVIFIGVAATLSWQQLKKPYARTLPILSYHYIRTIHDTRLGMTVIDKDRFEEEMRYLHDQGYTTLSMDEVVQFLQGKKFPPKIVAINFDDGLSTSIDAVPVVAHYGFKSTFWIITGVAQPDPLKPGADFSYMNWRTLKLLNLVPGVSIYSHTVTHPWQKDNTMTDWIEGRPPGKTANDVRFELTESKKQLEDHLGHPVPYLAWPSGIYSQALIDMAQQAGYTAVVTADDGLNKPGDDLFHIRRTMVNGNCDLKTFQQILTDGIYRDCGAN